MAPHVLTGQSLIGSHPRNEEYRKDDHGKNHTCPGASRGRRFRPLQWNCDELHSLAPLPCLSICLPECLLIAGRVPQMCLPPSASTAAVSATIHFAIVSEDSRANSCTLFVNPHICIHLRVCDCRRVTDSMRGAGWMDGQLSNCSQSGPDPEERRSRIGTDNLYSSDKCADDLVFRSPRITNHTEGAW